MCLADIMAEQSAPVLVTQEDPPLTDDEQEAGTGAVIRQSTGNESAEPDSACHDSDHPSKQLKTFATKPGPKVKRLSSSTSLASKRCSTPSLPK